MEKKFGIFSSSTDPTQVANSVRGLVLTFGALIVAVAGYFGLPLAASDIGQLAASVGMGAGALWTIYGLLMKAVAFFAKRGE